MIVLEHIDLHDVRPATLACVLQAWFATLDPIDQAKEHLLVVALNTRNQLQFVDVVCIGGLDSLRFHIREVYRRAVALGAAKIVLAHNHPSGACDPSEEDVEATKQLSVAGTLLGIPLCDHIIFSAKAYYSLADHHLFTV